MKPKNSPIQWRFTSHGRGVMRYESAEACRVFYYPFYQHSLYVKNTNRGLRKRIRFFHSKYYHTLCVYFQSISQKDISVYIELYSLLTNLFNFISLKYRWVINHDYLSQFIQAAVTAQSCHPGDSIRGLWHPPRDVTGGPECTAPGTIRTYTTLFPRIWDRWTYTPILINLSHIPSWVY